MFCYRHPDRDAYVRCQRCERFICPECQVEASVGFLCVDDAGGTAKQLNRQRVKAARGVRPIATLALIAINVLIWLAEISPIGSYVIGYLGYQPALTSIAPWQIVTGGFLHDWSSPIHLLVNMYTLYIFGQQIEPMLGRLRYLTLYMVAVLAGGVGVLVLAPETGIVVGASGAIFGLMGAYFILLRALGDNSSQMVGLIAINLVFGFMVPGISWQGHLGGLVGGAAVALVYARTRKSSQRAQQLIGVVAIVAILVVTTLVRVAQLGF